MTYLQTKIDFAVIIKVVKANPNGDPLNGNRPRVDYAGLGEMTDVCLKRKVRDRLLDRYEHLDSKARAGHAIFVQSDERRVDEAKNLRERAEAVLTPEIMKSRDAAIKKACATWFDVRAFGQVFPFKGKKGKKAKEGDAGGESEGDADGVSIPVRGPVTIQSAFSTERIDIESNQISKSTSLEGDGISRQSDQLGMKHRINKGVYVTFGSVNPQLAERTGFSEDDAEIIKAILPRLFVNDVSSARPDGTMGVLKVVWWKHNCKAGQYSSARVHDSLRTILQADGSFDEAKLKQTFSDLKPEIIDGF
jgi:CRISPR-associated protein Csd2